MTDEEVEQEMELVSAILHADLEELSIKEKEYRGSWKKRGGIGAFMMLCRKWDRIEAQLERASCQYDIFEAMNADYREEGLIDDIRDLRRYLALIETEFRKRADLGEISVDVTQTEYFDINDYKALPENEENR